MRIVPVRQKQLKEHLGGGYRALDAPLRGETTERLRRATEADLAAWADNVLDAGTLDEVFGTTR